MKYTHLGGADFKENESKIMKNINSTVYYTLHNVLLSQEVANQSLLWTLYRKKMTSFGQNFNIPAIKAYIASQMKKRR